MLLLLACAPKPDDWGWIGVTDTPFSVWAHEEQRKGEWITYLDVTLRNRVDEARWFVLSEWEPIPASGVLAGSNLAPDLAAGWNPNRVIVTEDTEHGVVRFVQLVPDRGAETVLVRVPAGGTIEVGNFFEHAYVAVADSARIDGTPLDNWFGVPVDSWTGSRADDTYSGKLLYGLEKQGRDAMWEHRFDTLKLDLVERWVVRAGTWVEVLRCDRAPECSENDEVATPLPAADALAQALREAPMARPDAARFLAETPRAALDAWLADNATHVLSSPTGEGWRLGDNWFLLLTDDTRIARGGNKVWPLDPWNNTPDDEGLVWQWGEEWQLKDGAFELVDPTRAGGREALPGAWSWVGEAPEPRDVWADVDIGWGSDRVNDFVPETCVATGMQHAPWLSGRVELILEGAPRITSVRLAGPLAADLRTAGVLDCWRRESAHWSVAEKAPSPARVVLEIRPTVR